MFKRTPSDTFTSVTYSVPSAVTQDYVMGLAPNASYSVTTAVSGSYKQISITAGGSSQTDSSGLLMFSTP
jgi:hypothetical protein